ncbi:MAG: thiamine pyrophosphate-binding protein [Gemmatimonadales bacterium]
MRALTARGVTHVVGLPDSISAPLFDAAARHPALQLVTVTREGEAFAVAAGLWIGGASPIVVVQNTGLLESGDAIRGTVLRIGIPIPILVTGRGYARMRSAGIDPTGAPTPELLASVELDSVALLTERTLDAWGVAYRTCEADEDPVEAVADALDGAREREQPVALVMARSLE